MALAGHRENVNQSLLLRGNRFVDSVIEIHPVEFAVDRHERRDIDSLYHPADLQPRQHRARSNEFRFNLRQRVFLLIREDRLANASPLLRDQQLAAGGLV